MRISLAYLISTKSKVAFINDVMDFSGNLKNRHVSLFEGNGVNRAASRRCCVIPREASYGDGEWHVKMHGESRRKKWKKMTLGIRPKTHEILFNITSDDSFGDSTLFKMAMDHLPRSVRHILMDGAGDSHEMYQLAAIERLNLITPQRKGWKYRIGIVRSKRDENIQMIYKLGNDTEALKKWKKLKGYHRRSLVETEISRIKGILLKTLIINKMNTLRLLPRA